MKRTTFTALCLTSLLCLTARADETCMSPYMAKIVGQEDFVYVWTLGVVGVGDEQDKLVTVDVNPKSTNYGKVVDQALGRRPQRGAPLRSHRRPRFLWATGARHQPHLHLRRPHRPGEAEARTRRSTTSSRQSGGVVGPHTHYALPGRMLLTGLSNNKDHGGRTALVEYTNDGEYVATHWMPADGALQGAVKTGKFADGYGYDVRALPRLNVLVTSSFTGWNNYMMNLGKLMADAEAMKHFGNTVVVWDLHTLQAEEDARRARRAARNPLRLGRKPQLLLHRDRAHLEDLADLPGRGRRVAGEGRRRHRRCQQDPVAGRHLDLGRRRPAVGRHVERRQGAPVRHQRSASRRSRSSNSRSASS